MKFKSGSKPEKLSLFVWITPILVVLLLIGGYFGYQYKIETEYNNNLMAVSENGEDVLFEVELGAGAGEIALDLETAGLIRDYDAFIRYLDEEGVRTQLQAGVFRLNPSLSVEQIVDKMVIGDTDENLLNIQPTFRLDEIRQWLIDDGFNETEVNNALAAKYNHPILNDLPKNATLEGYIYPGSYEFTSFDSTTEVVETTLDTFAENVTPELREGLKQKGLSFHESVILASIIQNESFDADEQKKIAQVFLSRLEQGIPLGSDPTFFYVAEITGTDPDPAVDNPYNTRIYGGLPPGPIGNFTISALEAIASPAETDFLYFVAGDDGVTRFSRTEAEHIQLTNEYCIEACKLD